MKRIFLYAYKNKNLGDDLFLKALCDRYSNVEFITLDYSNHIGVKTLRCVNNLFFRLFRSRVYIRFEHFIHINPYLLHEERLKNRSDACVFIGGSMFQQTGEWLKQKRTFITTFRSKGPFFVLGVNFGPYNDAEYFKFFKEIFQKQVYDITFRDTYSYRLFKDLSNTRYCPDILFSQNYPIRAIKRKTIGISVIDLEKRNGLAEYHKTYLQGMLRFVRFYLSKGYEVTLFSFCKAEGDEKAIHELKDRMGQVESNQIVTCCYDGDIDGFLDVFSSMEKVIATRFHAMVLSFCMGKPVLPIIYNEKMSHVLQDIQFDGFAETVESVGGFDIEMFDQDVTLHVPNLEKIRIASSKHFEKLDRFVNES